MISEHGLNKVKEVSLAILTKTLCPMIYALPFLPEEHVQTTYNGGTIFLNLRESPMMCSRALNAYEFQNVQLFESVIHEEMTFLDIGANKGYYTLLAAKLMKDTGNVFAFEPNPWNYYWLNKSVEVNDYESVTTLPLALYDENDATKMFLNGKKSGNCSLMNKQGKNCKQIEVKARTLDTICRNRGIEDIDLMKIDVEGAEIDVLRGAEHTLRHSHDLKLFIEVHANVNRDHLLALLEECGFFIVWKKEIKPGIFLGGKRSEIYARK